MGGRVVLLLPLLVGLVDGGCGWEVAAGAGVGVDDEDSAVDGGAARRRKENLARGARAVDSCSLSDFSCCISLC